MNNLIKNYEYNITLRWNSKINNCIAMFRDLSNIIKMDFSNFDTSSVTSMFLMFGSCSSLISLDLSNFKTSLVTDMCSMFYGCKSLTSLNIDNFNTSIVTNMYTMFYKCSNLKSLNINHFNTSSVTNMIYMFGECNLLTSLDISNFDTSLVTDMGNMFSKCNKLISLNLKNFNIKKVTNMEYMFRGCKSLIYLNLESFVATNSQLKTGGMFFNTSDELLVCLNQSQTKLILNNNYLKNIYCSNDCSKKSRKLIIDKKICTTNCIIVSGYEYEYNNICYTECPNNTHSSINNEYLCEDNLNCEQLNKYYDYDKISCIDKVLEGYFVNDTVKKTIDKCHIDCKTCDKKYTDTNSNCNSCLNNKYLDLGNCVSNCINGYYLDSSENKICKCSSNIECKECSDESLKLNLCISCNDGYYQKNDDIPNEHSFIKCYKNPEGYYLDNDTYKSCYSTCKNCSVGGDKNNNNCIECKSGYILDYNQNCQEICPFYYYYNSSNNYQCTEDYNCPKEQNKLIKEKNKCISNCNKDDIYQYEFNNTCFEKCPDGTYLSKDNNFLCIYRKNISNETNNYQDYRKCNVTDFFNGICKINNSDPTKIDEIIKNIRNELTNGTFGTLLLNLTDDGLKDLLVKINDTTYQLTTTDNQKNNEYTDISTIELGECENILKNHYHIDQNKALIIFKIDYYMPGISIPIIGYEVFNPNTKEKLDLSLCKDSSINLNIPVSINENDLFKHDPNSEYYTNECFPYTSEYGTDIILNDRKEEFIQNNLSLCENKCTYNGYNEQSMKASCECEVKTKELLISDIIEDKNLLSNNLTFENSTTNLITMKCVYTLFSKDGLQKNIANYIIVIIFILFSILSILFYKVGYYLIENDIKQIISLKEKRNNDIIKFPSNKIISENKKKKKKSKNLSNPLKKKNHKINYQINTNIENPVKSSSKIDLKNLNIFANSVKDQSNNNIKVYKGKNKKKSKNIEKIDFYDCELNSFQYLLALKYDKRTYIQYYISLLKFKHPLIFSFIPIKDYNTMIIKISLFLLSFVIYFTVNTLFFNNSLIHKIYKDQGIYDINYQLPYIIYSFIISHFIYSIIKYFSLSERDILKIKYENTAKKAKKKIDKVKKCIIIKYIYFYII